MNKKMKRFCAVTAAAIGTVGLFTVKDVASRLLPVALIASATVTVADKLGWFKKDDDHTSFPPAITV